MANPFVPKPQTGAASFGLLVLRAVVGYALCLHGWGKIKNPTGWMEAFGMPDPAHPVLQALAALSEFGGGIALVVGLLTPLAALGVACTMAFAVRFHVSKGDDFVQGYELAAVYLAVAICLIFCGPGKLSLDAVLFKRR